MLGIKKEHCKIQRALQGIRNAHGECGIQFYVHRPRAQVSGDTLVEHEDLQ